MGSVCGGHNGGRNSGDGSGVEQVPQSVESGSAERSVRSAQAVPPNHHDDKVDSDQYCAVGAQLDRRCARPWPGDPTHQSWAGLWRWVRQMGKGWSLCRSYQGSADI